MKIETIKVKTTLDKGKTTERVEEWEIQVEKFDSTDISITVKGDAAKLLTADKVLSLINSQYSTNAANDSRRERGSGPAKRIETSEAVSRLVRSLNCTEAQAKRFLGFPLTDEERESLKALDATAA